MVNRDISKTKVYKIGQIQGRQVTEVIILLSLMCGENKVCETCTVYLQAFDISRLITCSFSLDLWVHKTLEIRVFIL